MAMYRNYMETLVEDKFAEVVDAIGGCKCERCHDDVVAYALNNLPTKYVATKSGEVYSKLVVLSVQYEADVLTALSRGAAIVKASPRH